MDRDINDPRWKALRFATFKRFDFTCQLCHQKGEKLEAHHIIRYADNEQLRFSMNNLICLCIKCHQQLVTGNETAYQDKFKQIVQMRMVQNKVMRGFKHQGKPAKYKKRNIYLRW